MKGFSLTETLMALALVSIMSAFCFPIYTQHIAYEKRVEAKLTLNQIANALERHYLQNESYQNATLASLGFPEVIANNRYRLEIAKTTENYFLLRATPINQQAKMDTECAVLELTSEGERKSSGTGKAEICWLS